MVLSSRDRQGKAGFIDLSQPGSGKPRRKNVLLLTREENNNNNNNI